MSENNSEKIKISHRSFDLEEVRKQSPILFIVENDDDCKKKLYLLSPKDQFSEPDSHAFYKFPCLLKVDDDLFELHITPGAINISTPRDEEKKLLRDLKNSVRSSLSKPNKDSSDFINNIKKIAKWGRIDRITPKISPDLSDEMESFNTLIRLEPGWIEEEKGKENEKEKFVKNELEKILNSGKNLGMAITSKILRIANPETFVVFDSVFYKNFKQEDKKNFSFNAKGYVDFLKVMKKYKIALNKDSKAKVEIRLGDLEFAIYQLVQFVLKEFNWQEKCSIILNDSKTFKKNKLGKF